MGTVSRTYNFANGTVADADQVDTDFNTIYNEFNGSIDNNNLAADAAIATSKLELAAGTDTSIVLNNNVAYKIKNAAGTAQPILNRDGSNVTILYDGNGNEVFRGVTTASAVNELTATPSATGGDVLLDVTGGDTNVNGYIRAKGSGYLGRSLLRWDAGTLEYNHDGVEIVGWDFVTTDSGANNVTKTITHGLTFDEAPNVTVTWGGKRSGSDPSDVSDLVSTSGALLSTYDVTTTAFTVRLKTADGANFGDSTTRLGFHFYISGRIAAS